MRKTENSLAKEIECFRESVFTPSIPVTQTSEAPVVSYEGFNVMNLYGFTIFGFLVARKVWGHVLRTHIMELVEGYGRPAVEKRKVEMIKG